MIRSFVCLACGTRWRLIHVARVVRGKGFVCRRCVG